MLPIDKKAFWLIPNLLSGTSKKFAKKFRQLQVGDTVKVIKYSSLTEKTFYKCLGKVNKIFGKHVEISFDEGCYLIQTDNVEIIEEESECHSR